MIPFQGLIASALAIIALIVLWDRPDPTLWRIIFGLLIAEYLFAQTVKTCLKDYGMYDAATKTWGVITTITQLLLIILSIYGLAT